jgi:hypothetical protein
MNARQWIVLFVFVLMQVSCGGGSSSAVNETVDGTDPAPVDPDSGTPDEQVPAENPFEMHSQTFSAQAVISSGISTSASARYQATHQLSITR